MELKELLKKSVSKVLVLSEQNEYFVGISKQVVCRYCGYEPSKIIVNGKIVFNEEVDKRTFDKECVKLLEKENHSIDDIFWKEYLMMHKMMYFNVRYINKKNIYRVSTNKGQSLGESVDLVGCKVIIQEFLKDFKIKVK